MCEGMAWGIGDGGKVKVWEERWIIALKEQGMLLSHMPDDNGDLRVCSLIDRRNKI